MRPLVMDFNGDTAAVNSKFQYMFGKSLLVAPVTEANVNQWNVYLPIDADWFDFWTGKHFAGGQTIKTDAPLDKIPLFVKAGSVIPMGKVIQSSAEKSDTLEIRVYEGADARFELYEDEGDNYNYEKGLYSTITFRWDDKAQKLTISDRKGSFPGMLKNRSFTIVKISSADKKEKVVNYTGKSVKINL